MNKKYLLYLTFLVIIFLLNLSPSFAFGAYLADGIESFPNEYKPYLYELKNAHPNWSFKVLYTGINWNDAIQSEYGNGRNLVPFSYSNNWKCKEEGLYNIEVDSRMGKCIQRSC